MGDINGEIEEQVPADDLRDPKSPVTFKTRDDEIAALRAVIVEFLDITGGYRDSFQLNDPCWLAAKYRAANIVPGVWGTPPDVWSKTVAAAKALRLNQCQ